MPTPRPEARIVQTKGAVIYSTLLWATDGSIEADLALAEARKFLEPGGRIVAFHCDQRFSVGRVGGAPLLVDELERKAKIRSQIEALNAAGIRVSLFVATTHRGTSREIARAAEEVGAEAIFCGTRGFAGIRRALGSSVAAELLHYSHVPVIVVPAAAAVTLSGPGSQQARAIA
jgi:nucleotide-binding universal stress UspA family protein